MTMVIKKFFICSIFFFIGLNLSFLNVAIALPGQSEEAFERFAFTNKFLKGIKQIHPACQNLGSPNYYFQTTISGELIQYRAWIDCNTYTILSESLKFTEEYSKLPVNHPTLISVINELYGPGIAKDLMNSEFITNNAVPGANIITYYKCYQGQQYGYIIAEYSTGGSSIDIMTLPRFESILDEVRTGTFMEF